jgi:hypothetical protein
MWMRRSTVTQLLRYKNGSSLPVKALMVALYGHIRGIFRLCLSLGLGFSRAFTKTINMFDSMLIPILYQVTNSKVVFIRVIREKVSNLTLLSLSLQFLCSFEFFSMRLYIAYKIGGNQVRKGLI